MLQRIWVQKYRCIVLQSDRVNISKLVESTFAWGCCQKGVEISSQSRVALCCSAHAGCSVRCPSSFGQRVEIRRPCLLATFGCWGWRCLSWVSGNAQKFFHEFAVDSYRWQWGFVRHKPPRAVCPVHQGHRCFATGFLRRQMEIGRHWPFGVGGWLGCCPSLQDVETDLLLDYLLKMFVLRRRRRVWVCGLFARGSRVGCGLSTTLGGIQIPRLWLV